ncbi:radical SAM protein [Elusimicrobiota bacterium]
MNYLPVIKSLNKEDFDKNIIQTALQFRADAQKQLFSLARKKRSENSPQRKVEVRSVIEISNICVQNCNFCNINCQSKLKRYTITYEEFMRITEFLYQKGRRVLLIQSGENNTQKYIDFISKCIGDAKSRFSNLFIILCLGNLNYKQYRQLKIAGADRYINKFETSNPILYKKIKPKDSLEKRIECINMLSDLDFEVGSGNIVGFPGQTNQDLVEDLLFINQLRLSMISTSIFISGEDSNYSSEPHGDIDTTLNYMALMRILYPKMLIPSTSSLERAAKGGQYLGLMAGADTVTIHDGTPQHLKKSFPVYSINRFIPNEEHIKGIVKRANMII